MSAPDPPWIAAWTAAQRELLESWPAVARGLWETLQGSPAGPPGIAPPWASPAFGIAREEQEAWQRVVQQAARVATAQAQLTAAWTGILERSLAELGAAVRARAAAGRPVETLRAMYDLWVESAESVYAEAAAASPYVELQAELANASSAWRICQRDLLERWARQYDLPTRTELDALHRRTRALEAALRALECAPPARPVKAATRAKVARRPRAPGRRRGRTA